MQRCPQLLLFFFNDTATTEIYTLSLHDALPISSAFAANAAASTRSTGSSNSTVTSRSGGGRHQIGKHTSELQSRRDLVCRLLLEKKKNKHNQQLPRA